MLRVCHVNIARHIRAGPQRMASTPENPRAQIDEKEAVDGEG
jgi:hypothetical protein